MPSKAVKRKKKKLKKFAVLMECTRREEIISWAANSAEALDNCERGHFAVPFAQGPVVSWKVFGKKARECE